MTNSKLTNCLACRKRFIPTGLCERCEVRDAHHERQVPTGTCQQCCEPNLSLTKAWNDKYYCSDCKKWNQEASGIATCVRYTQDKELNCYNYQLKKHCGTCSLCQERTKLQGISTLALLTEVYWQRKEWNSLITWQDDDFIHRWQELMWELKQVQGLTPTNIRKLVTQDTDQKLSLRKFSRGN
jgi:hypothetical protein